MGFNVMMFIRTNSSKPPPTSFLPGGQRCICVTTVSFCIKQTLLSICVPERGEDAVSHKDAEAVDQRQLQTDVLEIVVGASQ